MIVNEISAEDLLALKESQAEFYLLDVREPTEYATCNLGGQLIPLAELPSRLAELPTNQHIIIHCHSGGRSYRAAEMLLQHGWSQVSNLRGGIIAWNNLTLPLAK